MRTIPGNGLIVRPEHDKALDGVLAQGCWTPVQTTGADLRAQLHDAAGQHFSILWKGKPVGEVRWPLTGQHNVNNALAALLAARHAGVSMEVGVEALNGFQGVRRRQTLIGEVGGIRLMDDFAHHPTAIRTTLEGLRHQVAPGGRLIAVFEPRSNTMRMGIHRAALPQAFEGADAVWAYLDPAWGWSLPDFPVPLRSFSTYDALAENLLNDLKPGDTVVLMSNGGFGGLGKTLLRALRQRKVQSA